jgi:hypothetical protein
VSMAQWCSYDGTKVPPAPQGQVFFVVPPTTLDGKCVAGLQREGRTILVVGSDFVEEYHRMWKRAVRRFL